MLPQKYTKLKLTELKRDSIEEFKSKAKLPVIIVLDNIRSMSNIGSFFRTADAFAIEEIHLCGITSTPPHKEIHKTALGATDAVTWRYFGKTSESLQWLKQENYQIAAIEQAKNSVLLNDFKITAKQKIALVFGNEVKGVDQKIINASDICIEIPQYGTKHSLNVSVSAGILLWEVTNQMRKSQL
jgi:tRNA G18 (ribose-2'-O)-methylase SpoU